jgi:hypothetical protein
LRGQTAALIFVFAVNTEESGFVSAQSQDEAFPVRSDLIVLICDAAAQFLDFN